MRRIAFLLSPPLRVFCAAVGAPHRTQSPRQEQPSASALRQASWRRIATARPHRAGASRYSIRAKVSGARIELVDMIAGPLDSSGAPGLRDGRIDALLDKGVYKLGFGVKGATARPRSPRRRSSDPVRRSQRSRQGASKR
jgi:hypothetical protein